MVNKENELIIECLADVLAKIKALKLVVAEL